MAAAPVLPAVRTDDIRPVGQHVIEHHNGIAVSAHPKPVNCGGTECSVSATKSGTA